MNIYRLTRVIGTKKQIFDSYHLFNYHIFQFLIISVPERIGQVPSPTHLGAKEKRKGKKDLWCQIKRTKLTSEENLKGKCFCCEEKFSKELPREQVQSTAIWYIDNVYKIALKTKLSRV